MFSDKTARNITLIIFFIFYLYLDYQRSKLIIAKSPTNLKCNPIQMIIGSIFEGEESANKTYKNCMEYSMNNTLNEREIEMNKQASDFSDKMSKYIDEETNEFIDNQDAAVNLINQNINNTSDLIQQQATISQQITDVSQPIGQIFEKIGTITKKLPDIFKEVNTNLSL